MIRTEIINKLASKINAKTYLEIGVRYHRENFDKKRKEWLNLISVDEFLYLFIL